MNTTMEMEIASFSSSLPTLSLSTKSLHNFTEKKSMQFHHLRNNKKQKSIAVFASRQDHFNDQGCNGHLLVDENMIILRKRIHEMKMIERNYQPPAEWMEWEKQYYAKYDDFICKLVGFTQTSLMNSRPSLALGFLALIAISVPVSTVAVASCLMEAAKVLPAIHIG